jgi:hypothetical protein
MVRHLWIIIIRKMAMKPLGSGVSQGDTTRNITNHFHGGRKPPFDTYLTEMSGHSDGSLLTHY